MMLRKFLLGFAALAILSAASPAKAGYSGTVILFALSANNGTSLSNATSITFTAPGQGANTTAVMASTGAYSTAAVAGNYTTSTLDLTNLASFSITNPTFGTFQAEASDGQGKVSEIVTQTASFLNIYLIGTYTGLPGFGDAESSLQISISNFGPNAGAAVFTLSTPPAAISVPEPASFAMLGLGLVAVGGALKFRRRSIA